MAGFLYLLYYIVPPLGAFKSQLGGTYSIPLLFYIVIDPCDYFIYIYIHVSSCLFGVFCMNDTFHVNNSSSFSKQVCVCVCNYLCIYIYIHVYICISVCKYMCVYIYMHVSVYNLSCVHFVRSLASIVSHGSLKGPCLGWQGHAYHRPDPLCHWSTRENVDFPIVRG